MAKPDKKPESINLTAASTAGETAQNSQRPPLEGGISSMVPEIFSTAGPLASSGERVPSSWVTNESLAGAVASVEASSLNSTAGTHESFTALSGLSVEDVAGTTTLQSASESSTVHETATAEETHAPRMGLSVDSITHPITADASFRGRAQAVETRQEDPWLELLREEQRDVRRGEREQAVIGLIGEKMAMVADFNRRMLELVAELSGHSADSRVTDLIAEAKVIVQTLSPGFAS